MAPIETRPILEDHHILCPACHAVTFASVHAGTQVMTNHVKWLVGDALVPGIERLDEQSIGASVLASVAAGECPRCEQSHFVIEMVASLLAPDALLDAIYIQRQVATVMQPDVHGRLVKCRSDRDDMPARDWLLSAHDRAGAAIHRHLFGPFPLEERSQVFSEGGVCSDGDVGRNPFWSMVETQVMASLPHLVALLRRSPE